MRAVPEQRSLGNVEQQNRDARLAMWLSLIVGLFMLVGNSDCISVYGIFCDLFRCSGIGCTCSRCRVCCVQPLAEHATGRSAIPLWV